MLITWTSLLHIANKRNVVSLQHNLPKLAPSSRTLLTIFLHKNLLCIFKHTVHVLVKPNDAALDSEFSVVK
jgi:hypothetical protein